MTSTINQYISESSDYADFGNWKMRLNLLLSSKDMQIQLIMVIWRRGEYLRKYPQLMNKKRKYFSFFLQTWSTNASNFRAKKILIFFWWFLWYLLTIILKHFWILLFELLNVWNQLLGGSKPFLHLWQRVGADNVGRAPTPVNGPWTCPF